MGGLLKWIVVVGIGLSFLKVCELYTNRAVTQINHESKVPVLARYEKSELVCTAVSRNRFESLAKISPSIAEFIVGLDPDVSKLAYLRWFVLVLVGWIHFCFLSAMSNRFCFSGLSKTQVFFSPLSFLMLYWVFSGLGMLAQKTVAPEIGGIAVWLADFAMGVVFIVLVSISVLSIPVSLGILLVRMVRGMKSSLGSASPAAVRAVIPGPIVRRRMIDGVLFDE